MAYLIVLLQPLKGQVFDSLIRPSVGDLRGCTIDYMRNFIGFDEILILMRVLRLVPRRHTRRL